MKSNLNFEYVELNFWSRPAAAPLLAVINKDYEASSRCIIAILIAFDAN
jgi:hypothetical protein